MTFRRKLAIIAVPAVLALAGGAIAVHAATSNPAPNTAARGAADPVEATTAEAPEALGAPDVGHADPAGDVNHEATGEER